MSDSWVKKKKEQNNEQPGNIYVYIALKKLHYTWLVFDRLNYTYLI